MGIEWSLSFELFGEYHPPFDASKPQNTEAPAGPQPIETLSLYSNIESQVSTAVTTKNAKLAAQLASFSFSETASLLKQIENRLTDYYDLILKEEAAGRTTQLAQSKCKIVKTLLQKLQSDERRQAERSLEIEPNDVNITAQERFRRACIKDIIDALEENLFITRHFWARDGALYNILQDVLHMAKSHHFIQKVTERDQGIVATQPDAEYGIQSALAVKPPMSQDGNEYTLHHHAAYRKAAKKLSNAVAALERARKNQSQPPLHSVHRVNRGWYKLKAALKKQNDDFENNPYQYMVDLLEHGKGVWFKIKLFFKEVIVSALFLLIAGITGIWQAIWILPIWFGRQVRSVLQDFPESIIGDVIRWASPSRYVKLLDFVEGKNQKAIEPLLSTDTSLAANTATEVRESEDEPAPIVEGPKTHITWVHADHPYSPKRTEDYSLPSYLLKSTQSLAVGAVDWVWQNPITAMAAAAASGYAYLICTHPGWFLHKELMNMGAVFFAGTTEQIAWSVTTAGQVVALVTNAAENPTQSYLAQILQIFAYHPFLVAVMGAASYGLGIIFSKVPFLAAEFGGGTHPIIPQTYAGVKGMMVVGETAIEREHSLIGKILIFPFSLVIGFLRLLLSLLLGSPKREFKNLAFSLAEVAYFFLELVMALIYITSYITSAALFFTFNGVPKLLIKLTSWIPGEFMEKVSHALIRVQTWANKAFELLTGKYLNFMSLFYVPLIT